MSRPGAHGTTVRCGMGSPITIALLPVTPERKANLMHRIIAPLTAAVAGTLLAAGIVTATEAHAAPVKRLAPCVFEDGSGGALPCLWDASKRGNHKGRSYWFDRQGHQHFIR